VAEWLGRGLQSLVQRFESARRLLCKLGLVVGSLEFKLEAPSAESVQLCFFDTCDKVETDRVELDRVGPGAFASCIEGVAHGQLYGFRVSGPWDPANGYLYNPSKVLLDPYSRSFFGDLDCKDTRWQTGVVQDGKFVKDTRDSQGSVPLSQVVLSKANQVRNRPQDPKSWMDKTGLIYEAHVKGATKLLEAVDEDVRGTYLALGSQPFVEHLQALKVDILELMPIQEFLDEPALRRRGRRNFWGYNTFGFFAPTERYRAKNSELNATEQLEFAISKLHEAGISVVLDVVYNHSAEGGRDGPTLAFRGIDNRGYYLLDGMSGDYVNWSGTGNTFDASSSLFIRLALDSMRYFVDALGVDGFRLDLGAALSVGVIDGSPVHVAPKYAPFYLAIQQDPVLRNRVLIAEPWDATMEGQLLGQFPPSVAEWNGVYRDDIRRFWAFDRHAFGGFATRVCGSEDIFRVSGRDPGHSINFVSCHDGFTLYDLTHYREKNNYENGEDNRDGSVFELNCYVPNDLGISAAEVETLRMRLSRSLIATLLFSLGRPMLSYGDEFDRSQEGNNNAYCVDSYKTWCSWKPSDTTEFATRSARLRDELSDLFLPSFLAPRRSSPEDPFDPCRDEIEFYKEDGNVFMEDEWSSSPSRTLTIVRSRKIREEPTDSSVLVLIANPSFETVPVKVPCVDHLDSLEVVLDSSLKLGETCYKVGDVVDVPAKALLVLLA